MIIKGGLVTPPRNHVEDQKMLFFKSTAAGTATILIILLLYSIITIFCAQIDLSSSFNEHS